MQVAIELLDAWHDNDSKINDKIDGFNNQQIDNYATMPQNRLNGLRSIVSKNAKKTKKYKPPANRIYFFLNMMHMYRDLPQALNNKMSNVNWIFRYNMWNTLNVQNLYVMIFYKNPVYRHYIAQRLQINRG